ncbi:MAG: hypothetical protein LBU58_11970, partial [Clostridiales bacterium]|nr:hypothetical protein [Clostridiales bacterium]
MGIFGKSSREVVFGGPPREFSRKQREDAAFLTGLFRVTGAYTGTFRALCDMQSVILNSLSQTTADIYQKASDAGVVYAEFERLILGGRKVVAAAPSPPVSEREGENDAALERVAALLKEASLLVTPL